MTDFNINGLEFAATTINVVAKTAAARDWFARHIAAGAVSATFPKSSAGAVIDSIQAAGLNYSEVSA